MMSRQPTARSPAGASADVKWDLPEEMANIWLGVDELDFSHGSLLPIKWIVAEVVGVFEPWRAFCWMAAGFCLFTGLTIKMQPSSYTRISASEVQSQSASAQGSTSAPSRAKGRCSQGDNIPRRAAGVPWWGDDDSLGLLFSKCRLPGVQWEAACLHFPLLGLTSLLSCQGQTRI